MSIYGRGVFSSAFENREKIQNDEPIRESAEEYFYQVFVTKPETLRVPIPKILWSNEKEALYELTSIIPNMIERNAQEYNSIIIKDATLLHKQIYLCKIEKPIRMDLPYTKIVNTEKGTIRDLLSKYDIMFKIRMKNSIVYGSRNRMVNTANIIFRKYIKDTVYAKKCIKFIFTDNKSDYDNFLSGGRQSLPFASYDLYSGIPNPKNNREKVEVFYDELKRIIDKINAECIKYGFEMIITGDWSMGLITLAYLGEIYEESSILLEADDEDDDNKEENFNIDLNNEEEEETTENEPVKISDTDDEEEEDFSLNSDEDQTDNNDNGDSNTDDTDNEEDEPDYSLPDEPTDNTDQTEEQPEEDEEFSINTDDEDRTDNNDNADNNTDDTDNEENENFSIGDDEDTSDEGQTDTENTDNEDDNFSINTNNDADTSNEDENTEDESEESNNIDQKLNNTENELFSNLSPKQRQLQDEELKNNYIKLYNTIGNIIKRVDTIPTGSENLSTINFIQIQLTNLKEIVYKYLSEVYSTKTYVENNINYEQYLVILTNINNLLIQIDENHQIFK